MTTRVVRSGHPRAIRRRIQLLTAPILVVVLGLGSAACDSATPRAASPAPSSGTDSSSGVTPGPGAGGGTEGFHSPVTAASAPSQPSAGTSPSAQPPAASPMPTAAAPSPPSPATAYDSAKFGFAAKGLRGEVMAFVTTSQVDDALARLDFAAVSTIAFFSLEAGSTGGIRKDGRWKIWTSAPVDRMIERAHASGTKVVISLARFSWSPAQTTTSATLLASAKARARLAAELADEVVRRGVDGVNVDFEPIPRGQKANFTDLVRRIRAELDARRPGLQLTFDVVGHFESYDVAGALKVGADAVFLMGYHYAGTFSTIAHATAPLDGPRYAVIDAIRGLRKVAKPHQLIVGVPYYGHLWPTASGALNARTTGRGFDVLHENARTIARERGSTYDPVEVVQRSVWRGRSCATCRLQWFQLYYDDARSLTVKWKEFRRLGLLGTGIWTTAFEGTSGDLTKALRAVWLAGE
ncbi:MAG: glycoside hydrolase family 18 protein [Chloroflexi bacterium]|nr:glycoside hydrolase family 18 protein [Chloroflexota bacterium]